MANPQLFGFRKLKTFPWPSAGAGVTTPVNQVIVDLKDFLQREIVSRVLVRAQGNVTVAGAGPGTPTGRDNPEAIIVNLNARHAPTLGVQSKNNITSRGIIQQGIFDRGYSIHAPAIADAAAVVAVDFQLPLMFKQPGSVNPIEWGLPLSLFEQYQIIVNAGGRDKHLGPYEYEHSVLGGLRLWSCRKLPYHRRIRECHSGFADANRSGRSIGAWFSLHSLEPDGGARQCQGQCHSEFVDRPECGPGLDSAR